MIIIKIHPIKTHLFNMLRNFSHIIIFFPTKFRTICSIFSDTSSIGLFSTFFFSLFEKIFGKISLLINHYFVSYIQNYPLSEYSFSNLQLEIQFLQASSDNSSISKVQTYNKVQYLYCSRYCICLWSMNHLSHLENYLPCILSTFQKFHRT